MFNGAIVRSLREERGLSTQQLADNLGLSRSYISMVERGVKRPSQESQVKIASFFRQPVERFTEESVETEPPLNVTGQSLESTKAEIPIFGPEKTSESRMKPVMVVGLVHGLLCEITQSIRDGLIQQSEYGLSGQSVIGDFKIWGTCDQVVLELDSVTHLEDWTNACAKIGRNPCAIVQEASHAQFIWFTEYVSSYLQVLQLRRWKCENKAVQVLDPSLKGYL